MTRHTRSQSKSSASAREQQPKPSPGSGMDLLDGSGGTSSSGSLFPAYVGEEEQNDSGGKVHIHVYVKVTYSCNKKNYNHK